MIAAPNPLGVPASRLADGVVYDVANPGTHAYIPQGRYGNYDLRLAGGVWQIVYIWTGQVIYQSSTGTNCAGDRAANIAADLLWYRSLVVRLMPSSVAAWSADLSIDETAECVVGLTGHIDNIHKRYRNRPAVQDLLAAVRQECTGP